MWPCETQQGEGKGGIRLWGDDNRCSKCPESNDYDLTGSIGVESEVGAGYAVYGKVEKPLDSWDPSEGWEFNGGGRYIGFRTSAYVEIFVEGHFTADLPEEIFIDTGITLSCH